MFDTSQLTSVGDDYLTRRSFFDCTAGMKDPRHQFSRSMQLCRRSRVVYARSTRLDLTHTALEDGPVRSRSTEATVPQEETDV
jgi:hypothetical protein